MDFEANDKAPTQEMYQKMGKVGLLASRIGPGAHLKMLVRAGLISLPGGVKPEEFDYFHEMIAHEEVARIGSIAFCDGLGAGMVISLPTVLMFGSDALKARVVPEVLTGNKRISLAVSEPNAGSDGTFLCFLRFIALLVPFRCFLAICCSSNDEHTQYFCRSFAYFVLFHLCTFSWINLFQLVFTVFLSLLEIRTWGTGKIEID